MDLPRLNLSFAIVLGIKISMHFSVAALAIELRKRNQQLDYAVYRI
jgi:hypothetical protein